MSDSLSLAGRVCDGRTIRRAEETDHQINEPDPQYVYFLAYAGLGVKVNLLVMGFDEHGVVKSYKIRQS